jgi:D-3-phosphoglycerate dehydrogenase
MSRVFISCPPLIQQKNDFMSLLEELDIIPIWADTVQQMTEKDLIEILPNFDGWILGDDPCSEKVLQSAKAGSLKAVVKWGVGTDNIDFESLERHNIKFANTPSVFGNEVADLAIGYMIALARKLIDVHNGVLNGEWLKPIGMSLQNKNVAIVGFGDIGSHIAKRCEVLEMNISIFEVDFKSSNQIDKDYEFITWPNNLSTFDFVILACALTPKNVGMVNIESLKLMKKGVRIINVSRGGLIVEEDLIIALSEEQISGVALDVFELEPLPKASRLRDFDNVIFGTHNASNTYEAVRRASELSIKLMKDLLDS